MIDDMKWFGAKIVMAIFLAGATLGAVATWGLMRPPSDDPLQHAAVVVVAAKATRAAIVPQVQAAAKEVVRATAKADTLRQQVVVLDDSTLRIQETPGAPPVDQPVHPLIVARVMSLEAENAALDRHTAQLETLVVADSGVIRALEHENALLKDRRAPRCSTGCGIAIGSVGTLLVVLAAALLGG